MATIREIARQVVDALPEDADFSDLDEDGGVTLPEMGDPSIKEVHRGTSHIRYRLLYDFNDRVVRILWFTNNTTCYRNVHNYQLRSNAEQPDEADEHPRSVATGRRGGTRDPHFARQSTGGRCPLDGM